MFNNGQKLHSRLTGWKTATALIIMMAFLGLASSAGWAAPKEQKKMTDQQITNAVDQMLLTDSALSASQIDAKVDKGIVTLTGTANNLMSKERAVKIAQTVRGVLGVVNTVVLNTPVRSDDEIRKDVEAAFYYDAATDSYELKTEVKDGVVTLGGTVQSYQEKQLAVFVAKGVNGVQEVKDSITVKIVSERPDAEIAADVKRVIAKDVWLNSHLIFTEVKNGAVMLTGVVGSVAQRRRAELSAWTAGVKSVNTDGLKIEPWDKASGQRTETDTIKSDPQIRQAVLDSLVYDPRVFSFNPGVEVEDGIVTLTGVVNNLKARRAAEQDAKNTVGVLRVKNLLKVRLAKPVSGDNLAQNVISAIQRDPFMNNYEINVKTRNGLVTLTGTVDSYYEKAQADDIASRAKGVVNVINNLTVTNPTMVYYNLGYDPYWAYTPFYSYRVANPSPYFATGFYPGDAELKKNIEDEMFWSPWVDLDDITVKATNGVVTLTGTVGSLFSYNKATENAYEGGAYQVNNNLTVK